EPTSGLDPVMSSVINQLIRKLQKDFSVTSFVVTHDMRSAYTIADRIAMLYDGKLIQVDTPDNIMNTENPVVRQFVNGNLNGPIEIHREYKEG
ncbi:MAG: ABC transporter ATP-binding protein, partial [Spirochaetota bacterium]